MTKWPWWQHAVYYSLGLGICALIPLPDGSLMAPLWLSLPVVLVGGTIWAFLFRHSLKK